MIIATVDKFAQMPWKGEVQTLFGKVSGLCERHGFMSPDTDDTGRHNKTGTLPRVEPKECDMLRPPDLIIQDELHLISGPLGTMVGLYETAVDELASWELDGKKIRPKVIASTATVRKAREQVHGVFLKKVNIFPPYGLDASDNFFSKQRPISTDKPGRRYVGICVPGQSRSAVLIRVYTAFLTAAQGLRHIHKQDADPWMTAVGYFNSLRELGGMRRLAEDDVRTRSAHITSSDFPRPGLSPRSIYEIKELTSRTSSTDIPKILDRLEDQFAEIGGTPDGSPIDVLLASNMISVGVDVQRLGLMIVGGQPKTTAEYIQATSRIGRHFPGIVCTVFNWARPRDLSHYETFEYYHASFYTHVEALSVTPFAPRAIDRGLTGVLASLIRLRGFEFNPNGAAELLTDASNQEIVNSVAAIVARAWSVTEDKDIKDLVESIIKDDRLDRWVREALRGGRRLGYKARRDSETVPLLKPPGAEQWDRFTTPTSMREVEPNVSLILGRDRIESLPEWRQSKTESDSAGGDEDA